MSNAVLRKEAFDLPEGVIYLDGNSLGPLPRGAEARVAEAMRAEWGGQLIRAWNDAGWMDLPRRVGDRIARLIGAPEGSVAKITGKEGLSFTSRSRSIRRSRRGLPCARSAG